MPMITASMMPGYYSALHEHFQTFAPLKYGVPVDTCIFSITPDQHLWHACPMASQSQLWSNSSVNNFLRWIDNRRGLFTLKFDYNSDLRKNYGHPLTAKCVYIWVFTRKRGCNIRTDMKSLSKIFTLLDK
ncbi:hypothetical protein PoB_002319900 [Plakobranchus ocellatus]|uniref:Uncharacterized protein n=1 Tax=Plakobranchus ocellatus TaxID=259542 RepID=A0AAV3ZQL7_9GAST|nr:hypothetical protein PoB_002319900 [Plakobranchus ocellatus]